MQKLTVLLVFAILLLTTGCKTTQYAITVNYNPADQLSVATSVTGLR